MGAYYSERFGACQHVAEKYGDRIDVRWADPERPWELRVGAIEPGHFEHLPANDRQAMKLEALGRWSLCAKGNAYRAAVAAADEDTRVALADEWREGCREVKRMCDRPAKA